MQINNFKYKYVHFEMTFNSILNPLILPVLSGTVHFKIKTVSSFARSAAVISGERRGTARI